MMVVVVVVLVLMMMNTINSNSILFSLNFAESEGPYFASIKFSDFERKLALECIKFREFSHNFFKVILET